MGWIVKQYTLCKSSTSGFMNLSETRKIVNDKEIIRGTNKFVRFCKRWRNYCLIPPFRIYKYALESCH